MRKLRKKGIWPIIGSAAKKRKHTHNAGKRPKQKPKNSGENVPI